MEAEDRRGVAAWSSAAWREAAVAWVDGQLAAAGLERVAEVEQPRVRPWATVLRVPVRGGPVWFKAAGPGTAFEVPLYELLARTVPESVLTPIATDPARAWVLLPDGGPPLAERAAGPIWSRASWRRSCATAGCSASSSRTWRRCSRSASPTCGPRRCRSASPRRSRPLRSAPTRPAARRCGRSPRWRRPCAAGASGWPRRRCRRASTTTTCTRGTCSTTGPAVCATTTGATAWSPIRSPPCSCRWASCSAVSARGSSDPGFLRARDAYLDVFSDLAPRAELAETLALACRVAKIARALTWHRALQAAREQGEAVDPDWSTAPLETLAVGARRLLSRTTWGARSGGDECLRMSRPR